MAAVVQMRGGVHMPQIVQEVALGAFDLVRGLRINDLVDIAILSLLIYKLLWLLRRSSSGRVMRGVLVLVLAMALSSWFELYALSFLINKAVEWGIVVLAVLFQPEIRRFLERMGSSGLGLRAFGSFQDGSVSELERAIAQTVDAFTSMSKDRVGALIVFERHNLLDEVIKTGTPLDCSVSSELLKNIFWNKAPLHDGAVVVREGRIVGAGCMLPLSGNVNLSRDLGMRHRAGIGMSEHSDAVVVMVSEETGSISAAVGGMLKRHLTSEILERFLRRELLAETETEKGNTIPLLSAILNWGKKGGE